MRDTNLVKALREHAMDFYWRLKAYEDTELTPEKIERSKLEIEAEKPIEFYFKTQERKDG